MDFPLFLSATDEPQNGLMLGSRDIYLVLRNPISIQVTSCDKCGSASDQSQIMNVNPSVV